MQPSDRVPPTSQSFVLNAMIASFTMPLLVIGMGIAYEAHGSTSAAKELLQVLFYFVAIMFPAVAPISMMVFAVLFLLSLGLAHLARRPWVAYPFALAALPLAYWVLVLVNGDRPR